MKKLVVSSISEVNELIRTTEESIEITMDSVRSFSALKSQSLFYEMKFKKNGKDPLYERPLNIIEQINQTYTYLVTFKAIIYLFENHPDISAFRMNLGTAPGFDIESCDGSIIAEVFASTSITNNQKIKKDINRLIKAGRDKKRYLFFHSPEDDAKKLKRFRDMDKDIKIINVDVMNNI
jgi:hypothetical protein